MKYVLKFSYDGSKYHGFQRQKNAKNVQGEIEKVLTDIFKEEILIKGAGRTDAKVHAINQCAHFETSSKIKHLKRKMNKNLEYIKIKRVNVINNDFHARYSVKEKIYIYKLSLDKYDDRNYYGYYYGNIDVKRMQKTAKLFVGTHNFKNFVAGYRDNYESTISKVKVYKIGKRIYFVFKGHGFYRYMVRNLVGALIEIGQGKVSYNDIFNMLENFNIEKVLPTAKAEGLYLKKIKY